MFPQQTASPFETNNVSETDLRSLAPGEWCRVQMTEVRDGRTRTRSEHIGLITQVDAESLTMDKVSTRRRVDHSFTRVPYLSRLYQSTMAFPPDEPFPVILSRPRMARLERISPEQAAEWKQPFERIGIDFDFNLDNQDRQQAIPVLNTSPESRAEP